MENILDSKDYFTRQVVPTIRSRYTVSLQWGSFYSLGRM